MFSPTDRQTSVYTGPKKVCRRLTSRFVAFKEDILRFSGEGAKRFSRVFWKDYRGVPRIARIFESLCGCLSV